MDATLETEHSRQSEFKTASEKESKRLMKYKSKCSTSNWHIMHNIVHYKMWVERFSWTQMHVIIIYYTNYEDYS